jgi:uncharacterized paraquat-inducible protein A
MLEHQMSGTKNITGTCEHCGVAFVYPAEHIGLTANCPHCGKPTELLLATPPDEPIIPRRKIVWLAVGCVVLVLGLVLSLVALNRARKMVAEKPAATAPGAPGVR